MPANQRNPREQAEPPHSSRRNSKAAKDYKPFNKRSNYFQTSPLDLHCQRAL
uniref:Uncharacterized protein n=1 Tax=Anguilla anguilla TaxID=7936 RepID=A0A0E9X7U1_ANGAN